jgi:hypothetical protein
MGSQTLHLRGLVVNGPGRICVADSGERQSWLLIDDVFVHFTV